MNHPHTFLPFCLLFSLILFGGRSASAAPESAEVSAKTTTASSTKLPAELATLIYTKRQQQSYLLTFVARPDKEKFQIRRKPSVAWPKTESFMLKVGETSPDNQFRVESFQAKEAKNELGIVIDASELTVTHLPTEKKYPLTRQVETVIPTYYAEFQNEDQRFFVKEGDTFVVPTSPSTKFKLLEVKEDSVEFSFEQGPGKVEKVKLDRKK